VAMTNGSSAVSLDAYDEYGIPGTDSTGTVTNTGRFQYTGQIYIPELGMYDYKARIYSPRLGRFMQTDPVGYEGGINIYEYAEDDPVDHSDPSGHGVDDLLPTWDQLKAVGRYIKSSAEEDLNSAIKVATPNGNASFRDYANAVGAVATVFVPEAPEADAALPAMARGLQNEAKVLADMSLSKNTAAVTTSEGRAIPDALTSSHSVEIKDAARVPMTRQVRIQTQAAAASGRQSVLVTGTNTQVTAPAQKAFDQVIRRDDLGPK
jgi:RHS repeat-associated protein